MEIIEWSGRRIDGPLVVVGFPSQGLVGGIAANYLIRQSKMWLAATLHDDELPPIAAIHGGQVMPPFQIWASDQRCGLDGECDQLVIVRGEVAPEPKVANRLASAILSWAESKDAKLVIALEGAEIGGPEATTKVFAVGTPRAAKALEATKLPTLPEGGVSGLTGALLVKGLSRDMPVAAFLVDARADMPDAKSAANIIQHLDPMLPTIPLDPKPLQKQARAIEKEMRSAITAQKEALARMQDNVMYH